MQRRPLLAGLALALVGGRFLNGEVAMAGTTASFGMIGKIKAKPGTRAELVAILAGGTGAMPGCLAYLIAEDAADPDAIWITELWDSKESHAASLKLPAVQDAIAKGRPLIAGFDLSAETRPVPGSFLAGV
jgi:quinol monooxygenase YgiN